MTTEPPIERLAVRVTPDAQRRIRGGHPWVFDRSVTSVARDGRAGDLAVVFDDHRRFLAIGLWDPHSPIRIRVLHHGAPTPIDRGFWHTRLAAALARRAELGADPGTTAYRVVHGENDHLPGLVVDRYSETLVVKAYTPAWRPHLPAVIETMVGLTAAERVVLRLSRGAGSAAGSGSHAPVTWADGVTVLGAPPTAPIRFLESGLVFEADVVHGQKTGHFLDQRENRRRVRSVARGAAVLDVFCCTGGFGVYAAAGGARSVHSVDLSPGAIATTQANMRLNLQLPEVAACRHESTVGDAFEVLARLGRSGRTYDLVIVDPPSFASRATQVDRAVTAYARLTTAAVALVRPGGQLVQASCSARVPAERFTAVVREAARRAGRPLRRVEVTGHPTDHPIGFPEGPYLKAVFAEID